jgi:hypothetical protein
MKVISETCHAHLIQYLHCIGVRYLMKVISEMCHAHLIQYLHLYWCEVPDESYSRNVSSTLNSISTFVLM